MALCTAHSKQSGAPCGRLAMVGQQVCASHGGKAPQAKRKAQERITEADARRELGKLSALAGPAEAVEDPLGELLQLAGEAKRWRELMQGRVAELSEVSYEGVMGQQVQAEIQVLERATAGLAQILTAIGKLNIDERLARISEQQAKRSGELLVEGVVGICEWLGLSAALHRDARHAAGEYVRGALAVARGDVHTPQMPPRPNLVRVVEREVVREVEVDRPCPTCSPAPEPMVIEAPPALPPSPPRRQIEPLRPMGDGMGLSRAMGGPWPQAWQ